MIWVHIVDEVVSKAFQQPAQATCVLMGALKIAFPLNWPQIHM